MSVGRLDLEGGWPLVRSFLPFDLDALAVETGALQRRRGVGNGETLLRALLLVALPKSTLRQAARTAAGVDLARFSHVALFKRLSRSEGLLQAAFCHVLRQGVGPEARFSGYRLLAADATCLCGPGAKGTDQRLHVVYDLGAGLPISVDLTDAKGGETLKRYGSIGRGDLVLADRGYGYERGLMSTLHSGARFLVRFEFDSLPLFTDEGERIYKEQAEEIVPAFGQGPVDFCAYLKNWVGPLRVIGERNPQGRPVWYLTDLPAEELPLSEARSLYRKRWQIELFFKRMKSLLDADELPSREGPTARPWIWAKLLLCALAVLLGHERFSPWEEEKLLGGVLLRNPDPNRRTPNPHPQKKERKASRKEQTQTTAQARLPLEIFNALS